MKSGTVVYENESYWGDERLSVTIDVASAMAIVERELDGKRETTRRVVAGSDMAALIGGLIEVSTCDVGGVGATVEAVDKVEWDLDVDGIRHSKRVEIPGRMSNSKILDDAIGVILSIAG